MYCSMQLFLEADNQLCGQAEVEEEESQVTCKKRSSSNMKKCICRWQKKQPPFLSRSIK